MKLVGKVAARCPNLSSGIPVGLVCKRPLYSNAQYEQRQNADAGDQHCECHGIVFEPLPIHDDPHCVTPIFFLGLRIDGHLTSMCDADHRMDCFAQGLRKERAPATPATGAPGDRISGGLGRVRPQADKWSERSTSVCDASHKMSLFAGPARGLVRP